MSQTIFRRFLFIYQKVRYEFKLKYVHDSHSGYHAYIIASPDYGNRNASTHATHRVPSANGYYISWGSPVTCLGDMDRVSEFWCILTILYIVHGGYLERYATSILQGEYTTKMRRKRPRRLL